MTLLIAILAVFGIWEFLLVAIPWTLPPWLQSVVVYGISLAFCWPDWRLAAAVCGGVGLCHVFLRSLGSNDPPQQVVVRRQRGSNVPPLP